VVAINAFSTDSPAELEAVKSAALEAGAHARSAVTPCAPSTARPSDMLRAAFPRHLIRPSE
jgi:hypothetical protein